MATYNLPDKASQRFVRYLAQEAEVPLDKLTNLTASSGNGKDVVHVRFEVTEIMTRARYDELLQLAQKEN